MMITLSDVHQVDSWCPMTGFHLFYHGSCLHGKHTLTRSTPHVYLVRARSIDHQFYLTVSWIWIHTDVIGINGFSNAYPIFKFKVCAVS
jgi:hypothetical protein